MARVARYLESDEQWQTMEPGTPGLLAPDRDEDEALARRLPPGIQPNNAIFSAPRLPRPLSWQRPEHSLQRRAILARVAQLLSHNAQLVATGAAVAPPGSAAAATAAIDPANDKTWALARKLEVLLFLHSASLLEYANTHSLARRVQALTASIVNKKIRQNIGQSTTPDTTPDTTAPTAAGYARPARNEHAHRAATSSGSLPGISALMGQKKRSVQEMQRSSSDALGITEAAALPSLPKRPRAASATHKEHPNELGALVFHGYEELSKLVWSYVDGVQIMRCRGVNREAYASLPRFVSSLQLSCNAVQRALATKTGQYSVLQQCVNLRHLEIVSLSSMGMSFGKLSMRATNCPQRFVVTHDDHEQIVLALAEQMRLRAFPQLSRLVITCLFTNEEADGEADVLLSNLMLGSCPRLEELCLPGNSFGDYGAMKVAQMLRSEVCPELTRLDLRRNFIGEDGLRSLCHALADGCAPNLVELCLGGNMITDSSFHHILFAMESGRLQKLRFLGIEANYLTGNSMEMLGRTIGKLVCPQLSQISYNDNSVENAAAKRMIATAVYQERMWQAKLQQQVRESGIARAGGADGGAYYSSDEDEDEESGRYSDEE